MDYLKKIQLPLFSDDRGDLGVLEVKNFVDWEVKRIYYVTNVTLPRGGHAVKNEKKFYICLKGKLKAKFYDGNKWEEYELNGPNDALLMEKEYYREFFDFSEDAVLLAVSSVNYNHDDYIYDLGEYTEYINSL